MKIQCFRFTMYSIIVFFGCLNLAVAYPPPPAGADVRSCGVIDWQPHNRRNVAALPAGLDAGPPRTVRLIYFLPNDRPFNAKVVQRMKDVIREVQTFYAEQMQAHGYGKLTFRVELDAQGEPMVHRVNGQHPDSHYVDADHTSKAVWDETPWIFNVEVRTIIYVIAIDISINGINAGGRSVGGVGSGSPKLGGSALVSQGFGWGTVAHELGHAFGLWHDFRDGAYIMSYGPGEAGEERLSACHAERLAVHPNFNPDIPIDWVSSPTIELISPTFYPAGSKSVSVQLNVSDPEGVHQVLLYVETRTSHFAGGSWEVKTCRGLTGKKDALVEFEYDGVIPSDALSSLSDPAAHSMRASVVDTDGNGLSVDFGLVERSPHHIAFLNTQSSGLFPLSFSPDGTTLASGSWDGTKLWDVMRQNEIATLEGHTGVLSVSFSPDGTTLASGSYYGTVILWDVMRKANIATLEGHTDVVSSVSFSPDGTILASGSYDGTVILWDVMRKANIATLEGHTDVVSSVSFSPDGTILASGSNDDTVKLWDVTRQNEIATLEGHTGGVLSVSFSPDGTILASGSWEFASGSWDGIVKLWDVTRQNEIATLEGHTSGVLSVSFSPDGTILASGSGDSTVKLWDVATRVCFATLAHPKSVRTVSFSPDGMILASGILNGTIVLWDTSGWPFLRIQGVAEIDIPDPNLRSAVTAKLGKPSSANIYRADMAGLTRLKAGASEIRELTGLQFANNLRVLELGSNSISDVSVLTGLSKLAHLGLKDNFISDLSPLVANPGLGSEDVIDVTNNPLSYLSITTHISALIDRGVEIEFTDQAHAALLKVSGDNAWGIPGTALAHPFVVEMQDENGSAIEGDPVTFTITAGAGTLSATSASTDANGRAQSTLTLGPNLDTVTVSVFGAGVEQTVTFNAVASFIRDSNLGAMVGTALNKLPGDQIVPEEMAALTHVNASASGIGDLTGLEFAVNLASLSLRDNNISDISVLEHLTKLTWVRLRDNNITDLSPLTANMGLGTGDEVDVRGNPLSYSSIHTHIPTLRKRGVSVIYDHRKPASLVKVSGDNQIGPRGATLANPSVVKVSDENGAAFEGVPLTFAITAGDGTLSATSTTTDANGRAESTLTLGSTLGTIAVSVSATGLEQSVTFNAVVESYEFDLSLPSGISLIHVPLKAVAVDGIAKAVESVGDLYDALGGANAVNLLITHDPETQLWRSYLGDSGRGSIADAVLTADLGIIAVMDKAVSVRLEGAGLGAPILSPSYGSARRREASITLRPGANLVDVPFNDSRIARVSDLYALDGIRDNVTAVIILNSGEVKVVAQAGDDGDVPITGGQSFIMYAKAKATVAISGKVWNNISEVGTVPPDAIPGIEVGDATPVLALTGSIVDEVTGLGKEGFHVTVKNLSTGREVSAVTGAGGVGYQFTVVDFETARAAQIGDILEVSAQAPERLIRVQPMRHTVTPSEVKRSQIQLAALVARVIPPGTSLLPNYPNPFNPETWIPYRLAWDSDVTLTIFDRSGRVVRMLEVGHRIAGFYESADRAIYWDGRNQFGEQVANGVYFYMLTAKDFTGTRRMVILR